jgi:ABC-type Zn uptake system ZnuABC Zn-binding protein ZnuA
MATQNSSLGRRGAVGLGLAAFPAAFARPARAADKIVVMASLQATYSIACALAKDTAIDVRAAFPADVDMEQQAAWLTKRRRTDFIASAKAADAVITIRRIWDLDPLYSSVRAQNIRVIEIDASTPFSPEMAGVALLSQGKGAGGEVAKAPSPYIWLNLTNAVRMTDIISADLRRLSEADAKTIDRNQQSFRANILALRTEYEGKIGAIDDASVISLHSGLAYMLGDIGLDVAATMAKSDFDWTDADIQMLRGHLAKTGSRAVVAARQPKEPIVAAIATAGARLVVLDLIDPGVANADGALDPDGFLKVSRSNLKNLLAALQG